MKNLGILQGRLLKPINGLIQEFPFVEWEKEIPLMESLGFEHFEWIINIEMIMETSAMLGFMYMSWGYAGLAITALIFTLLFVTCLKSEM